MNADERTKLFREQLATTPTFPIIRMGSASAPSPFDGLWCHSTLKPVASEILQHGWKPELVKNTIYGAAIYLSRKPWYEGEAYSTIEVVLDLHAHEVASTFDHASGRGNTQKDLIWHLQKEGAVKGQSAGPGHSGSNRAIRDHFLGRGVKAVHFTEHGFDVVAVYDPNCIRVR